MLDRGPRRAVKTAMQDARTLERGGSTALLMAAQAGSVESARLLLAAGASPNDAAADGNSALVMAAFSGHGEVAAVLLEAGADPNAAGAGYTALHAAALRGDLATVTALLAKGANPDAPITRGSPVRRFGSQWALPTTLQGATPLVVAAAYVETEIMRALLGAGARADAALAEGTSALLVAAGAPVEKEARPSDLARWNIVDSDTPVVPRAEADVLTAVTLLLDAGANVNDVSLATGDTALHGAAGDDMPSVDSVAGGTRRLAACAEQERPDPAGADPSPSAAGSVAGYAGFAELGSDAQEARRLTVADTSVLGA